MVKKIKSSLSAKSFLFIALLLVLCGLLIYSSVVLFLPNSYTIVASDRINQELRDLAATLSETNFTQADDVLATFCRDNRASVLLTGWGERLLIGYVDEGLDSGDVFTTTLNVTFADRPVSYTLTVSAPISAGHELTMAFGELLPVLLVIVLVISALGAFHLLAHTRQARAGNQPHISAHGRAGHVMELRREEQRRARRTG